MIKLIDQIPFTTLIFFAVIMLLLPFSPMPHVLEKIIMLKNGELTAAIDIFDLFYHLIPSFLLIIKVVVMRTRNDQ